MSTKIATKTTHVILRDEVTPGTYAIWSQHRSESAALKLCRALGKSGAMGHTVVVSVDDIGRYKVSAFLTA